MSRVVVSGIGTGVGKTVTAAWLCLHWDADYWKPIQAGLEFPTDADVVRRATGFGPERTHPEAYRLKWPASPHAAAAAEGVRIDLEKLNVPDVKGNLVIEGAGGLMVPLREDWLYIDLIEAWKFPVVLVVHTYLGCINHSLLSLEALRTRGIPLAGIVFNDGGHPESEEVIVAHGGAPVIGRLPRMDQLNAAGLRKTPLLHPIL